ncbi:DUF3602 domain-containing protein [Aspergillus glaucus CBS 516.65]|uniref:Uncharacterized protein n=1 Tax=Aspergillus glaucus CBS 516.65 TaxID=1160497 RepID=A0A1L9V7K2_ASPGL|nr:hypothetical protein ASPGLDRAFT_52135 [Aspergillus glaucus CBS 516.65]OJJ79900.1 hypothetical protein ASPGLDRAFT_52135 [Aspergillus glaucus CBS 516.65]
MGERDNVKTHTHIPSLDSRPHNERNEPIVSHGRGGKGNIAPDPTPYVDAAIVREGPYGDQGDGAYSAGRGGAGNINSQHVPPTSNVPHDAVVVPEPAIVPASGEGDFHVGRGGQGNVYLDKEHAKEKEEKKEERKRVGMSLLDKVKHLFGFGK